MMDRHEARERRHVRIRKHLEGTTERPRLAVFRSAKHIYAQVVDDRTGRTLVHASSCEKELRELRAAATKKRGVAEAVGKLVAQRCVAQGVKQVAFDRGGFRYHGRVAALAKGAREGGLSF
ncbi:50S ribosomal protein L18 [Sphingomonas sp. UBA4815]|uniref:50S ribosomal protein L18 n=1 Tax=Sphingomonas sp. UBA4815 TaxID=1947533 RepID=UPI0031F5479F